MFSTRRLEDQVLLKEARTHPRAAIKPPRKHVHLGPMLTLAVAAIGAMNADIPT